MTDGDLNKWRAKYANASPEVLSFLSSSAFKRQVIKKFVWEYLSEGPHLSYVEYEESAYLQELACVISTELEEGYLPPPQVGRLRYNPEGNTKFVATASSLSTPARKTFTWCHEMGHVLLGLYKSVPIEYRDSLHSDILEMDESVVEMMCDIAASYILFRPDIVQPPRWEDFVEFEDNVQNYQNRHTVSYWASARYLTENNPHPSSLIMCKPGYRKEEMRHVQSSQVKLPLGISMGPHKKLRVTQSISSINMEYVPLNKSLNPDLVQGEGDDMQFSFTGPIELSLADLFAIDKGSSEMYRVYSLPWYKNIPTLLISQKT